MKKYLSLLKYELKPVLRDPVNLFMCLFPVIVLILSCYVFPLIMESVDPTKGMTLQITMLLLLVIILAFGSMLRVMYPRFSKVLSILVMEGRDNSSMSERSAALRVPSRSSPFDSLFESRIFRKTRYSPCERLPPLMNRFNCLLILKQE